eukprot:710554-Rhodomonas_salina.1
MVSCVLGGHQEHQFGMHVFPTILRSLAGLPTEFHFALMRWNCVPILAEPPLFKTCSPLAEWSARANYERRMQQTFAEDVKRQEYEAKINRDRMLMGNATR